MLLTAVYSRPSNLVESVHLYGTASERHNFTFSSPTAHNSRHVLGHHGVLPISCMDYDPEPSRGIHIKVFPRRSSQSCASGRRSDRVSSMYHLALRKCFGISRHTIIPTGLAPHACDLPHTTLPPPNQSLSWLTTHMRQLWQTLLPSTSNSSASLIILRRLW